MWHLTEAEEPFTKTESVTAIQRGFGQQFQRSYTPSHSTLLLWASNWHQEESVKDSKLQGCPHSAHTPNNTQLTRDTILWSLCRSAWWQALPLHLNNSSIRWILHKDLHHHLYKIQVAQKLSKQDRVSSLYFCDELLDFVNNNHDTMNALVMSHTAHLHVWYVSLCE